jgi:hypothetical protein
MVVLLLSRQALQAFQYLWSVLAVGVVLGRVETHFPVGQVVEVRLYCRLRWPLLPEKPLRFLEELAGLEPF